MELVLSLVITGAFLYFVPKNIFRYVSDILERKYTRVDRDISLLITGVLTLGSWVILILALEKIVEIIK